MRRPSITFQPHSARDLMRGIDVIADLVRPTIGPNFRHVASEQLASRNRAPELLSDGATLARRMIQISSDGSDMGAMLLRQAVWQVGERAGDGTATTAILARGIIRHAYRMTAAGANPMRIRTGIEKGVEAASAALRAQATPVSSRADLTKVAQSLCHDQELARILGEAFNIIGADGWVEVQTSRGRKVEREYVEGAFWSSSAGWLSSSFKETATATRVDMQDAAVLLLDGRLNNIDSTGRMLGRFLEAGITRIFMVCREVSDAVLSVLVVNHQRGIIKVLPVKMPVIEADRIAMFEDIAALTGATVIHIGDHGDTSGATPDMLGGARRLWSETTQFGIIGGKGSPKALRDHIQTLRRSVKEAKDKEKSENDREAAVRKRVARLMGGTCVLSIGAPTETEQKTRQQVAERCVRSMYAVVRGGIVPGGGAAYLACQEAVSSLTLDDPDVRAGADCVAQSLDELMRAIAHNAGVHPSATVHRARTAGPGYGLNAETGVIEDMRQAGIIDSAEVLEQVLRAAGSVAGTTVTTDVLVRRRKPTEAMTP